MTPWMTENVNNEQTSGKKKQIKTKNKVKYVETENKTINVRVDL